MTERWFYARDGRRQGPVPRERLIDLARDGWLSPDDLVWSEGMPEWTPARSCDWLWGGAFTRTVNDLVEATLRPERQPRPIPHPLEERRPLVDWDRLEARHLLAVIGGFVAALGIAFTVIARTRFALTVTLIGLALLALGRQRESAWLLRQAWENIARACRDAARRRAEARRLAEERRRTAAELAARTPPPDAPSADTVPTPPPVPTTPPPVSPATHRRRHGGHERDERIIVYQPPVRRYSPGVAGCLSLFIPGLGQLYKRQFLNAIAWFLVVAAGYAALVIPGVILHLCCILGALSGDPWTKGRTVYVDAPSQPPRGD